MSLHWTGTPKPPVFTPDDSPRFMQEGFEPKDSKGISWLALFGIVCLAAGILAPILRRIWQ